MVTKVDNQLARLILALERIAQSGRQTGHETAHEHGEEPTR